MESCAMRIVMVVTGFHWAIETVTLLMFTRSPNLTHTAELIRSTGFSMVLNFLVPLAAVVEVFVEANQDCACLVGMTCQWSLNSHLKLLRKPCGQNAGWRSTEGQLELANN